MYVLVILLFLSDMYYIANDQVIYQNEESCEVGRMNLLEKLEASRPKGGKVFIKCVSILGDTRV